MASNSNQISSSSHMIRAYDVFVSFRGKDTRNGFTDHLFAALQRKSIFAFRDDKRMKKGESIALELIHAIEGSRVFIVVFSKNYASSTWCLQELAKMVECIQVSGKRILPVFYDVDPSEVRKQSGDYKIAFAKHEERFKEDLEMRVQVQRWREALTQVAGRAGWDLRNKPQIAEIENIVEVIIHILGHKFSSLTNDLVGWQSPIKELEKLLLLGADDDVRVLGICGLGGIGKTTLATILYSRISHQYDACCFIDDVSKIYQASGPTGVQKHVLHQALNDKNLEICSLFEGTYLVRTRLCHARALIVLDNVDQVEQLEKLAVYRECLGAGSRIIIISRDKHILKEYGIDAIYNVKLLNEGEALQLFCKKAFKCDYILGDYEDLTKDALQYAKGLPLAIKVLGSFLFGRDISGWTSALARMRENPDDDIMNVLRISYDGLKEMEKEIFLDIACFFNHHRTDYVANVLDDCGFHSNIGLGVLIDKSFITIWSDSIRMHDLLQELGRKIVRENSPTEPRKWSRLWLYEDLYNVLVENTETKNPVAVVVDHPSSFREGTTLKAEGLSKISSLRLLILKGVSFSGSLRCLSNKLRYLEWEAYPFKCLPSSFQPNKLGSLIMPHSSIKQPWEGIKALHHLRVLNFCHSKNLIKLPDFRGISNLEKLELEGCTKLVKISPSIGLLGNLYCLNLKNCKNLISMPNNIFGLNSLSILSLSGCSHFFNKQLIEKPRHAEPLKKLDISEATMQCQSTSSITKNMLPFRLSCFGTNKHSNIILTSSLVNFPCLRELDLSFCNLHQLPDDVGWLTHLERLNIGGNQFVTLPCSMKHLSKLRELNLEHCKELKYLPELPTSTVLPQDRRFVVRLLIFNCPNLCEMEQCSRVAFSWMIQVLQAQQDSCANLHRIDIVIPGSQIPKWFNNQTLGNNIGIEPSSIIYDKDWIGIVVSVVFVVHIDPTNLNNITSKMICYFHHRQKNYGVLAESPIRIQEDLLTPKSDHLWLVYFSCESFTDIINYITQETDDFDGTILRVITDQQPLCIEIKNVGFRWVYKQDIEGLRRTMTPGGNSSIQIHDDLGDGQSNTLFRIWK